MKKLLLYIIIIVCIPTLNAQELNKQQLSEIVKEGQSKWTQGVVYKDKDSLSAAVILLEKYTEALKDNSTRKLAIEVEDPWTVFGLLSSALNEQNNIKITSFINSIVRPFYHENGSGHFEQYFYTLNDYYSYFSKPQSLSFTEQQQKDSLLSIGLELHSEAVATNEESLILSTCKYMVGNAKAIKGDFKEAIQWLEKARETGLQNLEKERGTHEYFMYLQMLSQLMQGYTLFSRYDEAIDMADQIAELSANIGMTYSQLHLSALASKMELLARKGSFNPISTLADSISNVLMVIETEGILIDQQASDYVHQLLDSYYSSINPSTTNTPTDLDNQRKVFEDEIAQLESNPNLDLFYYNTTLYNYCLFLIGNNQFRTALDILEHAEYFIKHKHDNIPFATRFTEALYSYVWHSMGNNPKALHHLYNAENMFEQASDHSLLYIQFLCQSVEILINSGDYAYAKLYLDKVLKLIEDGNDSSFDNSNTELLLVRAVVSTYYFFLGYSDVASNQLQILMNNGGMDLVGTQYDLARRMWAVINVNKGNFKEAVKTLRQTLKLTSSDFERKLSTRFLVLCNAKMGNDEAVSFLETYDQNVRQTILQNMQSLTLSERQSLWEQQSAELASTSHAVLRSFPSNNKACELSYNVSLYSKSMQDVNASKRLRWKEIRRMLGDKDVAIEFITMPAVSDDNDFTYGALIIRKDYKCPKLITLCPTNDLDGIWREIIHTDQEVINRYFSISDNHLYSLIWEKIVPLLNPGDTVYYSPVGFIERINHNAISDGQIRMSDKYVMRQVSTTALINMLKSKNGIHGEQAFVYGGIDYDAEISQMVSAARKYRTHSQLAERSDATRGGFSRGALNELSGTLDEALLIEEVLKKQGYTVTLLTDHFANEESFKALNHKAPDILHIATHGFMLSTNDDTEKHFNIISSGIEGHTQQRNLMQYCGLLLAGSHKAWSGIDVPPEIEDGVLTSYEISQTNLNGCKLAVLSACETGLGFINYFGNSTGLIQAFKKSGVETIIATLWEVPDDITSILIQKMFTLISQGIAPHTALLEAQETVQKTNPEPYNWAGFIVID